MTLTERIEDLEQVLKDLLARNELTVADIKIAIRYASVIKEHAKGIAQGVNRNAKELEAK